jgi:hypothetical protein
MNCPRDSNSLTGMNCSRFVPRCSDTFRPGMNCNRFVPWHSGIVQQDKLYSLLLLLLRRTFQLHT